MNKLNYIDIFAGCGGLSLGFHNAGWKGTFAIEKSPFAFKTLKHNLIDNHSHFSWVDWLQAKENDINEVLHKSKNELKKLRDKTDLVVGGPPCQGFSFAGTREKEDERNNFAHDYLTEDGGKIYLVKITNPEKRTEFNNDKCIELRKKLKEHSTNIRILVKALDVEVDKL